MTHSAKCPNPTENRSPENTALDLLLQATVQLTGGLPCTHCDRPLGFARFQRELHRLVENLAEDHPSDVRANVHALLGNLERMRRVVANAQKELWKRDLAVESPGPQKNINTNGKES